MASLMITAAEVAEIMDCSTRFGYDLIQKLNGELERKGFITIRGKVSRRYFFERVGLELSVEKEVNKNAE